MVDSLAGWKVTGGITDISGRRQRAAAKRFEELIDQAIHAHRHLWMAAVGYLVEVPLKSGALLDPDVIIGPPMVSCFICEGDYVTGAETVPCPGWKDE